MESLSVFCCLLSLLIWENPPTFFILHAVDSFRVQASYFVECSTIWMCHVRFMRCTLDRNRIEVMCISQCVVAGGM